MSYGGADARVPSLDGVRGIAFLIVYLAHIDPRVTPGGNIGVDLFFVLSGFLITSILLDEHRSSGTIAVTRFYIRRALRLLPALYAMVAILIIHAAVFAPESLDNLLWDTPSVLFYYFNWHLVATYGVEGAQHAWSYGHLWSLSIEEQFYIFWPFVLLLILSPKAPRWAVGGVIAVGLIFPAVGRMVLWESGSSLDLYYRTDLRFDSLMWGAAGAWILKSGFLQRNPAATRHIGWVGGLALIGLLGMARFNLLSNGFLYLGGYTLVGALACVLILAAATDPPPPLRRLLEFRPLRWTGKISYGLYLWHIPAVLIAFPLPLNIWLQNAICLAITFGMASISYYGMERHFLALKDRLAARRAARPAAVPAE